MKEREYFRHVCSIMISRNRRVNFAAVLDNHGKLAPNIAQKELIPLYDMISPVNRFVKIGIISLNERKDRYLCVYTDDRDIKTQILAEA